MKNLALSLVATLSLAAISTQAADKKIVFIAGNVSHGAGDHEHRAGSLLFKSCLDQIPGYSSVVYSNGWPKDAKAAFDGADAIVIYSDGGGGHPAIQGDRLQVLEPYIKKGVGFGCVHYAVEVPKDKGGPQLLDWIGGYFETDWSVNPFWDAEFKTFPSHPAANGLKPFSQRDEWYFHMRFREGMKGVTPILSAVAPEATMKRPDGPHSGNPAVRESVKRGDAQHLMWVAERPDGGRGFGFTGGHSHKFWDNENFRKSVLNGIVWIAKGDVPKDGITAVPPAEQFTANLDPKGKK